MSLKYPEYQESDAVTAPVPAFPRDLCIHEDLIADVKLEQVALSANVMVKDDETIPWTCKDLSAEQSEASLFAAHLKFARVTIANAASANTRPALAGTSLGIPEQLNLSSASGLGTFVWGPCAIEAFLAGPPQPAADDGVAGVLDPLADYDRYATPNWDYYGAKPILAETIEATRQLLDVLPDVLGSAHISPGPDGTIGLEWVFSDKLLRKLYIDVGPGKMWAGYWRRASGERKTIAPKPIDADTKAELNDLFKVLNS